MKPYRPGKPNWEFTVWRFKDFSNPQILSKPNFVHFGACKTDILTIWEVLNFKFLDIFDIFKCDIPKKSKFKSLKLLKWQFMTLLNQPKLISHEISVVGKWPNPQTVVYHSTVKIPNKLRTSSSCLPYITSYSS